jgi:hypothetical protein
MSATVLAVIGAKAIYFLYAWLIGCMLASTAARLKGYPEKAGLATGMLLSILGGAIWMFFPWRRDSRWARAVEPTDLVTVAGGFMLGGTAFLKWFENDAGSGQSLFQAEFVIGVPVFVAGALAVVHVLLAASETGPGWILTRSRTVVLVAGAVALALALFAVVSPPTDHDSLRMWPYVALIGGVLTVVGPLLARLRPFPQASQMEH